MLHLPLLSDAQGIRLYRKQSFDSDVRHCHERLREAQGIQRRYTWVQTRLQRAGLVPRRPRRDPQRLRRLHRPLPSL